MIILNCLRFLMIASLIVSMPTHPMGDFFSTKAKIGAGVVAAVAAFVGYRVWSNHRRARQEAWEAFSAQVFNTAHLFTDMNNISWYASREIVESSLDDIRTRLSRPTKYRADPDMTYRDVKSVIKLSIVDGTTPTASLQRGNEMPLEERPITLIAKRLMFYPSWGELKPELGSRLQFIQLFCACSKLPLDVTDHEGNIRKIMYMDSKDVSLIASLNQRRQGRRGAIHDSTNFSDVISDIVFCYDDPLMKDYPIPLKSGNAVLASWPEQKQLVVGDDSDDEKE